MYFFVYIFFHLKLLVFLAGKLGVQDYAVVYPPNGTHVSLGILYIGEQHVYSIC